MKTRDIQALAFKAARMTLVFMLVFWSSLRVEYLVAFADDPAADSIVIDDGSAHAADKLVDLALYQWSESNGRWMPVPQALASLEAGAAASGVDPATTVVVELTTEAADQKFVAFPIWQKGEEPPAKPAGYDEGIGLQTVTGAAFVEWKPLELLEGSPEGSITSNVVDPAGKNMLVVSATANGKAKITCQVKKSEVRTEDLAVSFTANATGFEEQQPSAPEQQIPLIDSVDLLDAQGQPFVDNSELSYDKDQLPVKDYQLKARVKISNQTFIESGVYEAPSNTALSELSGGLVDDLAWSITSQDGSPVAADVAAITPEGVLTITGEGEFTVHCTAHVPASGQSTEDTLNVKAGNAEAPDDPQGPSHPQATLQIVADIDLPQGAADDQGDQGGSGDADGQDTENPADQGQGGQPNADANSGDAAGAGDTPGAGENTQGNQGGAGQNANDAGVQAQAAEGGINRTYTAEELAARSTGDPRLFKVTASGKAATITGQGVSLMELLRTTFADAGADLDSLPVKSVKFSTHRLEQTVPWSYLQNSQVDPMLAVKSYIHVDGEDSADAPVDQSKLVDNARFRLLCGNGSKLTGATSVDADDYRWVNKITLNFEKTDSDRLAVGISYTPVSKGVNAEFVAVPNHNVTGSWNCTWEASADGKGDWEVVGSNSQTLSIPTNDQTIGTWYRVTIHNTTGNTDGDEDEELMAVSEPVELVEGKGLVLSYNPPIAGGLAIFRTHLFGVDTTQVEEYIWQWTDNGGESWQVVRNEKGANLKIPTEPINESASSGASDASGGEGASDASSGSGGASTPNLIYIRAIAVMRNSADGPLTSNVQPLTVHTGDGPVDQEGEDEGQPGGTPGDDEGRIDGQDGPKGGETTPSPAQGPGAPAQVTEIQQITLETTPPAPSSSPTPVEALDPQGTQTVPTSAADRSKLVINDAVSQQIVEQVEAKQATMEATTPGARWTKLNTLDPTSDDVRNVLAGNPFAPFVIPLGLGATAAGGVESFIAFRRQVS